MTSYRLSAAAQRRLKAKRREISERVFMLGGKVKLHPAYRAQLRREYEDLLRELMAEARKEQR